MNRFVTLIPFIGFCFNSFAQTVDFSYSTPNGLYCTPAVVKFTPNVQGSPTGYVWTFGNNLGSNLQNPVTTYTAAGTYVVKLLVIYKKHTLQVSKTIAINPAISPAFTVSRNELCMPGTITFTAGEVNNIASYEWNFGDTNNGISTTSSTTDHYFSAYQVYPVSYKVTANTGCYAQSYTSVSVQRPGINATATPLSGCIPAPISFSASTTTPGYTSVNSYKWNFGDDAPIETTTAPAATHIYNNVGNYTPTLQVRTPEGCSNELTLAMLQFGIPPLNHVAYPKKLIFCGSESPEFVSHATNANKYFWDFDDGDTLSVTDTVTRHRFRTLGVKNITVTPLFNDCPGQPISFSVEVIGVISGYNYSNTCTNKKQFSFINHSQGNLSEIVWQFGDGSPASQSGNVVHSYPDTGTFLTSLRVYDNITGCSDTYTSNIYTAFPLLANADTSICRNSNTSFTIPRNYNNPNAMYTWNVIGNVDGPVSTLPYTLQASVLGHFSNNHVIINNGPQYCPDTIPMPGELLVRGPQLAFDAPAEICVAKPYNILNSSTPYVPTDIINYWHWSYSITLEQDSVFQPLPHFFPYWGTFDVKLTAIDIKGCMDTLVKQVRVSDMPFLRSIPYVDTLCAGHSTTLIAFHNDPITWSPATNLNCVSCDTVTVTPAVTTVYYVTATNQFNCSVTDSLVIQVHENFTAAANKPSTYICANENVQLDITPKNKIIQWSPVSGLSDASSFNPIAAPVATTTYTVTLKDSAGCFTSSTTVDVQVKSLPRVNAGPDMILPYNTDFAITPAYSSNVRSYSWTPAAQLNCNSCPAPVGRAMTTQHYSVMVISDSGCVAKDNISVVVACNGANILLPTAFTPNGDNTNDYFYPITRAIKKIKRFAIYSRSGLLMYEMRDYFPNERDRGWDGKYRGNPQESSAYVYALEAECDAGETINRQGSFVLIR